MDIKLRHSLAKLAWLEFVTPEVTGPTKRLAEKVIKKTIRNEVGMENTLQPLDGTVVVPTTPVVYPTSNGATGSELSTGFDQKIASYCERYR